MIKGTKRGTFLGLRDEHGHEIHCAHAHCPNNDNRCYKGCADRMTLVVTQSDIDDDLANAQANGFFTDMAKCTVAEIVADLQHCSPTCEGEPDEVLTPLVQAWYTAQLIGDSQAGKAADC